jgi:spermidine synthase
VWTRILLLTCFTLSGVSGLIYEVVWTRKLGFIFGSTAVAIGVCLAVYLGGLALGSYFSGPIADRMSRPARAYALMELAIGACGLLSLPLLDAAGWIYARFEPLAFVLVALALLPPTILLGGTLPVVIRAAQRRSALVTVTGRLYSANTLGGVAGAALAGFVLLPHWGMLRTAAAAGALNLALAGALWLVFGQHESPPVTPASNPVMTALPNPVPIPVVAIVLGISGFCALLDEVIWARSLEPVVGSSTWSFAIMLSPFLLGLALGIAVATRLARAPSVLRRVGPVAMLAWALSLTGSAVFLGMFILHLLPEWFSSLYADLEGYPRWFLASHALVAGSISFVPAFCIGTVFPLALALSPNPPGPARLVGRLYSINTAGSIAGACLAGLVVIPWLGLRGGLLLAIAVNLAAAASLLIAAAGPWRTRAITGAIPIAVAGMMLYAAPAWDRTQMTTGVYSLASTIFENGQDSLPVLMSQPRLRYYREGAMYCRSTGLPKAATRPPRRSCCPTMRWPPDRPCGGLW